MAELAGLLPQHREQLTRGSGIAPEVITARGYRSISPPEGYGQLKALGFSPAQARNVPGLLLPLWAPDGGGKPAVYIYRPDTPRQVSGRPIKYELPKGASVRVDSPPRCRPTLADPSIPLWITEGQKKADALASHSLCAIALLGVWAFKGRNSYGGVAVQAD